MIATLGTPTLFFTLSAVDLHWPELYHLLAPGELLSDSPSSMSRRQQLLNENPLIVNTFFYHRAKYFLEQIVGPHFKVKDFWYRFEWQHRGSPHLHGFLWLQDAPNVDSLSINDRAGIDEAILFFDGLVTAMNPNENQQPTSNSSLPSSAFSSSRHQY
jgi:hypothetical protein